MPENTDPLPPPERPLPDDARARIRADLVQYAQENGAAARGWLVPAGAAAAVALVAGMAWWAVSASGSDGPSTPVAVGGAPSSPTASPTTPQGPSTAVETAATTPPSLGPTGGVQVGTGTCPAELENVLRGAQEVFGVGPFSYWVKGGRYSVCFEMDGSTTVTHPLALGAGPLESVAAYRVISVFPPTSSGYRAVRAAGGPVPPGATAFSVDYTFPDGHTQSADIGTDAQGRSWWRMEYSYDPGKGNELDQPPITVTVSLAGVQRSYTLQWASDTCAQANHGC